MQNNLLDCHMLIVVTSIEVIKEATFFQPGTDANEEITLEMLASGKWLDFNIILILHHKELK